MRPAVFLLNVRSTDAVSQVRLECFLWSITETASFLPLTGMKYHDLLHNKEVS